MPSVSRRPACQRGNRHRRPLRWSRFAQSPDSLSTATSPARASARERPGYLIIAGADDELFVVDDDGHGPLGLRRSKPRAAREARPVAHRLQGTEVLDVDRNPCARVDQPEHAIGAARFGVLHEIQRHLRLVDMGIVRTTYLIGADGKVAKLWDNVKVDGHAEDVLASVQALT